MLNKRTKAKMTAMLIKRQTNKQTKTKMIAMCIKR